MGIFFPNPIFIPSLKTPFFKITRSSYPMHNYVIRYIIFCFYSIIFPICTIFREIISYEICKLFTNVHIT